MNDSIIKGKVIAATDTGFTILTQPQDSVSRTISVAEMHTVKVKRDAFLKGFGTGVVVGGAVGYGVGYAQYSYDYSISPDDNDEQERTSAWTGAVIGAVPAALLGGAIGGLALKKKFVIRGKQENFWKLVRVI